jgi:hypothetical protein
LWQRRGWKLGEKVWRQEFQLRREPLKQLGMHTVGTCDLTPYRRNQSCAGFFLSWQIDYFSRI